jgi:hypothetical protein
MWEWEGGSVDQYIDTLYVTRDDTYLQLYTRSNPGIQPRKEGVSNIN